MRAPCSLAARLGLAAIALSSVSTSALSSAAGLQSPPVGLPAGLSLSRDDADAAILQGIAAAEAGKPATALLDDVRRVPLWVSGRRGDLRGSSVWFKSLAGANLRLLAYQSVVGGQTAHGCTVPASEGYSSQSLDFDIVLKSTPQKVRTPWHIDPSADPEDVRVERFEISDDRGNLVVLVPGRDFSLNVQELSKVVEPSCPVKTADSTDEVRHSLPSLSFEPGSARPHYQAQYRIRTSLWDPQGKPRISADAREIRLAMVTRTGRMEVNYSLPPTGPNAVVTTVRSSGGAR